MTNMTEPLTEADLEAVARIIREAAREVAGTSQHYADLLDSIACVAEDEAAGGES